MESGRELTTLTMSSLKSKSNYLHDCSLFIKSFLTCKKSPQSGWRLKRVVNSSCCNNHVKPNVCSPTVPALQTSVGLQAFTSLLSLLSLGGLVCLNQFLYCSKSWFFIAVDQYLICFLCCSQWRKETTVKWMLTYARPFKWTWGEKAVNQLWGTQCPLDCSFQLLKGNG